MYHRRPGSFISPCGALLTAMCFQNCNVCPCVCHTWRYAGSSSKLFKVVICQSCSTPCSLWSCEDAEPYLWSTAISLANTLPQMLAKTVSCMLQLSACWQLSQRQEIAPITLIEAQDLLVLCRPSMKACSAMPNAMRVKGWRKEMLSMPYLSAQDARSMAAKTDKPPYMQSQAHFRNEAYSLTSFHE